jgi:glycopeptide antibiotics resistance protein
MTTSQRRLIFIPLLLIYLLALFALALRPSTATAVQWINLVPFSSITQGLRQGGPLFVINIIGNIVVFVPVGLLLPLISTRFTTWLRILLAGFAVSLTIEMLQLLSAQRVADVDDLLLNVAGTLVGYSSYMLVRRR